MLPFVKLEEQRTPVGRPDFKPGERRETFLVGSTPTLFRQVFLSILAVLVVARYA